MSARYVSTSVDHTRAFGAALVKTLPQGSAIALVGELGAGKTALVQGAASGIGAHTADDDGDGAMSPTFVLQREYWTDDGFCIVHVDAHRLESPEELTDIGGDDMIGTSGVAFVEWADRVSSALPASHLVLRLSHRTETTRRLEIEATGPPANQLVSMAVSAAADAGLIPEGA